MKVPSTHRPAGIALVITLVMLSVIAFMAIAFLVLSRGEKSSVATVADQTTAKLAADTGVERAKAELLAPILAFQNEHNYDLMVSTNYINDRGFDTTLAGVRYTNVNFLDTAGLPLTLNDFNRNLANLYFSPRAPVYVKVDGTNDFRYYLDLNRNGRYDTNGYLPVMSGDAGFPFFNTNGVRIAKPFAGNTLSNFFVGDPEWIGQLERPGFPHSPSNRFVARYAYLAVPAGKTLDINAIHNNARQIAPATMNGGDGFLRNQGVGPWEINLAGFLADLNTNYWFYGTNGSYNLQDLTQPNRDSAFDDALSILRFRYGWNMAVNMQSVANLFGNPGRTAFETDFIDGYSAGPLMRLTWWPSPPDADSGRVMMTPWSGADNPQKIFSTQDLFDRAKFTTAPLNILTFSDRLRLAGQTNSSYDRYTFYRLLSQLGTDSSLDNSGQMNLNYDNLTYTNVQGRASATNFVTWEERDKVANQPTGLAFFTNAAARLFASAGFNFNITNIQLYPTNYYTPSVHRLVQLAANMYDATTSRVVPGTTNQLPTVFRPILTYGLGGGDNVYITGYAPVVSADDVTSRFDLVKDLTRKVERQALRPDDLAYGVPLVIGAKKGLPNFNEFAGQTAVQITRKFEFRRGASGKVAETNQMFLVGISNVFGLEAWNSYNYPVPYNLQLIVQAEVFGLVTNDAGVVVLDTVHATPKTIENIAPNTWPGFINLNIERFSFRVPIDPKTNAVAMLPNSTYQNSAKRLVPLTGVFERNQGFPDLNLHLNLRTRFKFALVDRNSNRLVDYVSLDSVEDTLNLPEIMSTGSVYPQGPGVRYAPNAEPGSLWATNRYTALVTTPNFGVLNQFAVGAGSIEGVTDQQWRSFTPYLPTENLRKIQQDSFRQALLSTDVTGSQIFYSPFNPVRTIYINRNWQANDPLVHYTMGDLMARTNRYDVDISPTSPVDNIRRVNGRYEPWTEALAGASSTPTRYDLAVKDPLVTRSDDWDFPTNRFPNVGWLGRVHRGTPWQTVYLKSTPTDPVKWTDWTRNDYKPVNYGQVSTNLIPLNQRYDDAVLARPDRDREMFDLFTTSFSETASRGKLSINQTNLAAWSAVLSGVIVLTNNVQDSVLSLNPLLRPTNTWMAIQPAGPYDQTLAYTNWPQLVQIVKGINDVRATTNFNGTSFQGTFRKLGDILAVPQLTVFSPFISTNGTRLIRSLDDAAVERIPQQILGLLKVEKEPRFVIYSYGQSLKPADRSVLASGPFFGLCTNYQVTAEVATRSVVRIEGAPAHPKLVVESYNPLPPE